VTRLAALLASATLLSAARQPFTLEDWWAWHTVSDPQITPDGEWVLYTESWPDRATDSTLSTTWRVSLDREKTRGQTPRSPGFSYTLPSPDGSKIAWLDLAPPGQFYAVRKLWVKNADGTRARPLSGSLDRDVTSPQWSSDSRTVYFLADDRGATRIYAAHADGSLRQVTNARERLRGLSLADNGRAVTARATPASAEEIYTLTVDHVTQPATLASPNERLLAEREIAPVEEIQYASGGQNVQAWIVKPPAFDPAKKYPMLVEVRDNPRAMFGVEFNLEAQIAAARGFVVLLVNPRGTPGYGEVFGNLLPTANPGDDSDDLMRGVDAMLAYGYIDPHRIALLGGIVAAWTIGHTDRFRAAVVHGLTAPPDPRRSPLEGAFETPTLVIAGDDDPLSEALYTALAARDVQTEVTRIPKSPKPSDRFRVLENTLRWLAR
jgi:acylaminoacyl-peptidase